MALVATPGAADADSYASVAEATAYLAGRGNTTWAAAVLAAQEAALRRATAYLDNAYRGRWRGFRSTAEQSLAWPRSGAGDNALSFYGRTAVFGVVDEDGYEIGTDVVPVRVKSATIEAALLTLDGVVLEPRLARGGAVLRERKKAGSAEIEREYAGGASATDRLVAIEGLLRGLVTGHPGASFGMMRIVRA